MSKAITWGKFKELFKNCSDDTIMNFSFLTSFEDIRKWFEDEVNKEKTEYFKRGYQSCIDDEIKTKYGFEKEDCCLNKNSHFLKREWLYFYFNFGEISPKGGRFI